MSGFLSSTFTVEAQTLGGGDRQPLLFQTALVDASCTRKAMMEKLCCPAAAMQIHQCSTKDFLQIISQFSTFKRECHAYITEEKIEEGMCGICSLLPDSVRNAHEE